MAGVTFEFKSERNWLRVWEAVNDTEYPFASYGYKTITVFSEKGAEELRAVLKRNRIAHKEI
jgi:hypothetical protein